VRSLLILLACIAKTTTVFGQGAEAYFNKGMAAFNKQAYEQALEYFQKADQLNLRNKRLQYNLGVTYYKLGRYTLAFEALGEAATDRELASLAYYNRALCALKLDDQAAAVDSLHRAYAAAATEQERLLAKKLLTKLEHTVTEAPEAKASETNPSETQPLVKKSRQIFSASASLSMGYNDNVTLNVIEDAAQSGKSDRYGGYSAKLGVDLGKHWDLSGKAYGVHYQELNAYDYDSLSAALTYAPTLETALGQPLEWFIAGVADRAYLESKGILDTSSATITVRYPVLSRQPGAQSYVQAKYAWSDVRNLQERYAYLAGNMNILDISARLGVAKSLLNLAYQYETNRRRNFTQEGRYIDFSPTRHKIVFSHDVPVFRRTTFEWGAGYRKSDYQNANQLSTTEFVVRADERLTAAVRILHKLSRHAWVIASYQYLDNRSNIDSYTYTANTYSLSVVWN
jgi:tetratricopeptide (TPR) repeat protein